MASTTPPPIDPAVVDPALAAEERRRRGLILLVIGVVIGLIVGGLIGYLVGRPGAARSAPSPTPTASPSPSYTPTPSPEPTETPSPSPSPRPSSAPPTSAPPSTARPSVYCPPTPGGQASLPPLPPPDGSHSDAGHEFCGQGNSVESAFAIPAGSTLAVAFSCPPGAASSGPGGQAIVVSEVTAQGQPGPDRYQSSSDSSSGTQTLSGGNFSLRIVVAKPSCQWHVAVYTPR